MKPGSLVEITWDDHAFHFGQYAGEGTARCTTVGYFVREDEQVIAVALSMADGKPNDVQVVDKRMLVTRRTVRR